MAQTYTIWFNRSFLKIVNPATLTTEIEMLYEQVIKSKEQLEALLQPDSVIFDGKTNDCILVAVDEPANVLEHFKKTLKLIFAGGGIIFNEHKQLLLIKRKGFWDLPKGKMELGEKIRITAIREVEEETNVKIETAAEQSFVTYHTYLLKGEYCIKETHWFEMDAALNQEFLIPQKEEGIEEVLWAETADLPIYKENAYPLIWSILEGYLYGR